MSRITYCLVFLLFNYAFSEIVKSSLTFVIDDTGSMQEEIDQVKDDVYAIFETVLSSNESQIENFVLVTFNDPGKSLRAVTKDKNIFKNAVASIRVDGGGDCPENAMSGIELALENSLPKSYLYVFTDASAKDYENGERMKALAMKKECQVVFVLTGICGTKENLDYLVYHDIADATQGHVFQVGQYDVKKVLEYVKETLQGRRDVIAKKHFPPGEHDMDFYIDPKMGKVTIAVTGTHPKVNVTSPDGEPAKVKPIVELAEVAIHKIIDDKTGVYKAKIGSTSKSTAVVTGSSLVNFEHGFSTFRPKSLDETATRPQPGGKTFLTIKPNGVGVKLDTAKLIDIEDNVLMDLPLHEMDETQHLYITESFSPPIEVLFKLKVFGHDDKSILFTRTSPTAIKVAEVSTEIVPKSAPVVKIEGEAKISVDYDSSLQLRCKVRGHPKPQVVWVETTTGVSIEGSVSLIDVPNYISILDIENIKKNTSYRCKATNEKGFDEKTIDIETVRLFYMNPVEVPKDTVIEYKQEGRLTCDIDAFPPAIITWYFNEYPLANHSNVHISGDRKHVVIRQMEPKLQGRYICRAKNEEEDKTFHAKLTVSGISPPIIEEPKHNIVKTMVGRNVALTCNSRGRPNPSIKWIYQSPNPKVPSKVIMTKLNPKQVNLYQIQLKEQGNYTCIASNIGGWTNITYEVLVHASPIIQNIYKDKKFIVVDGDLGLKIKCSATGSPRPTIIWKKDNINITLGYERYYMEDDGTLVIRNIDEYVKGKYLCLAYNNIGNDREMFEVEFRKYPPVRDPITNSFVKEGQSVDLKCNIPRKPTDSLRWYKDGALVSREELRLPEVSRSEEGIYTCRVSDYSKSQSESTRLKIGRKPEFVDEQPEWIDFEDGELAFMICEANGNPKPEVIWKYNGEKISNLEMTYVLKMTYTNRGKYDCQVFNEFGSIDRSFTLKSRNCLLDVTKDFPSNQPLMLSSTGTWPSYDVNNGYMSIPKMDYFYLFCPRGFKQFPTRKSLITFCKEEDKVMVNGNIYNFAEITCNKEVKPTAQPTGIVCGNENTELINIGYTAFGRFIEVYTICLDKAKNVPIYAQYEMPAIHVDSKREVSKYFDDDLVPISFDVYNNCSKQNYDTSVVLNQAFHLYDGCCFGRRQLVNSQDLQPGVPATVSYSYLNVVPHWSTCGTNNWDEVERKVRSLSKASGRELLVTTGTAEVLDLPGYRGSRAIHLQDQYGRKQTVSKYLWKIVQDPETSSSLAIIQVNIPDLSKSEAVSHTLCRDICYLTDWMKSPNWQNPSDGYTYCCTIKEFERAFGFRDIFVGDMNNVLFDASLLPEASSLTK